MYILKLYIWKNKTNKNTKVVFCSSHEPSFTQGQFTYVMQFTYFFWLQSLGILYSTCCIFFSAQLVVYSFIPQRIRNDIHIFALCQWIFQDLCTRHSFTTPDTAKFSSRRRIAVSLSVLSILLCQGSRLFFPVQCRDDPYPLQWKEKDSLLWVMRGLVGMILGTGGLPEASLDTP